MANITECLIGVDLAKAIRGLADALELMTCKMRRAILTAAAEGIGATFRDYTRLAMQLRSNESLPWFPSLLNISLV